MHRLRPDVLPDRRRSGDLFRVYPAGGRVLVPRGEALPVWEGRVTGMAALIDRAIGRLLGSCDGARTRDGAGLSLAHQWLRHLDPEAASPGQLTAALRALVTYSRTQLPDLRAELLAALAAAEARIVTVTGAGPGWYRLAWPYDAALVGAIKAATNGSARWDGAARQWVMPAPAALAAIAVARAAGWEIEGDPVVVSESAGPTTGTEGPAAPAPAARADVTIAAYEGDLARVTPQIRLGDVWARYKAACDAAGYRSRQVAGEWRQLGAATEAESLATALRALGLTVQVAPGLGAAARTGPATEPPAMPADGRPAWVPAETWGRLYGFQRAGVAWLLAHDAGLLGDEQGLGKTIQALMALPPDRGAVVIGPATLKLNWAAECRRWRPDLRPTVLSGRGSWRWPAAGELVIVNYDILPPAVMAGNKVQPLAGPPAGVTVIVDEAHMAKSTKTARTKALRAVLKGARHAGGRCILMTGTPLVNRPPELWCVLMSAGLAYPAFDGWQTFVRLFGGRKGHFGGYEWGRPAADVPERLQRVMLRRERADQLDLPAKRWRTIPVNGLGAETLRACDEAMQALDRLGLSAEGLERQVGAGMPEFAEISRARALLAAAKIPALVELVESYEEEGEPLVVFSSHRAGIDVLGERDGWATITGDTPQAARQANVEAFQAGTLRGLACTIRAAGVGITLTRAAHALFVDLDWTPAGNAQAEDRLQRIGQTRPVLITRLVADHPLDQRLLELLADKASLVDGSISAATAR